jgi:hypothetical protein
LFGSQLRDTRGDFPRNAVIGVRKRFRGQKHGFFVASGSARR